VTDTTWELVIWARHGTPLSEPLADFLSINTVLGFPTASAGSFFVCPGTDSNSQIQVAKSLRLLVWATTRYIGQQTRSAS
jgi:hypothetical protein